MHSSEIIDKPNKFISIGKLSLSAKNAWIILFTLGLLFGVLYSLIQPLGMSPDEAAHMKYVKFIALNGRLPIWNADGGGEAGYEAQHPPLYYVASALIYKCSMGLSENWRWQILRWFSLLIGALLIIVARGFFMDYFHGNLKLSLFATAIFIFTPLVLEYMSYINPDILSVLLCGLTLWMCLRIIRGEASVKDRVVLCAALGLGLLTKLTILGTLFAVLTAFLLEPSGKSENSSEQKRLSIMKTFLGAVIISGWWYFRNSHLYHKLFLHTNGQYGSGYAIAAFNGYTMTLLMTTLQNTFFTIWVERMWMPASHFTLFLFWAILIIVLFALLGWVYRLFTRQKNEALYDSGVLLCSIFFLTFVLFHQLQVWAVDYEFNAGGRYLLNALIALYSLMLSSFRKMRLGKVLCAACFFVLMAMNVSVICNLINTSGLHLLQLTIPYK